MKLFDLTIVMTWYIHNEFIMQHITIHILLIEIVVEKIYLIQSASFEGRF